MIQKTQSFTSSDGAVHLTLAEAQKAEVRIILNEVLAPGSTDEPCVQCMPAFASAIVDAQDRILDVLTTRPSSRPKQRKVNGFVARKRTTKPAKTASPEAAASA